MFSIVFKECTSQLVPITTYQADMKLTEKEERNQRKRIDPKKVINYDHITSSPLYAMLNSQ